MAASTHSVDSMSIPAEKAARTIQAAAGPALGSEGLRRRVCGRIGGLIGREDFAAAALLERALGDGGQLLTGDEDSTDLVVDADGCRQDGQPVEPERWRSLLSAGQLAAVEGAFALGSRTPTAASRWPAMPSASEHFITPRCPAASCSPRRSAPCWRAAWCRVP